MREFLGKEIVIKGWNQAVDFYLTTKKFNYLLKDQVIKKIYGDPPIKTIDETITKIVEESCSVSRFGDGELMLILGKDIAFQKHSSLLERKLKKVLKSNQDGHIVCLPDVFGDLSIYTRDTYVAWKNHLVAHRRNWLKNINRNQSYYNAFISRCYLNFLNPDLSQDYFSKIKRIWDQRDIVIVEGEYSRLGVDNDLFNNASSIKRILCPNKEAFSSYDIVFDCVTKLKKDSLILLALGPTASILAYDLHKEGYQAIDIGHIDVEYEWFLMGAKEREPIHNKYVFEVNQGEFTNDELPRSYLDEILININDQVISNSV